jgi:hypothetical protein
VSENTLQRIARLVALFNEGSLDVPDGLIAKTCVFRLNGVAYEDTMGRPVSDPLVRLVARGPAGYRLLSQALRYAAPDVRIRLDRLVAPGTPAGGLVTGTAHLEGTLRGGEPLKARAAVAMVADAQGSLAEVAAVLDEGHVAALAKARER